MSGWMMAHPMMFFLLAALLIIGGIHVLEIVARRIGK